MNFNKIIFFGGGGFIVFFGDVQDKGSFEIRKLFSRIFKKSFPRKYTYKVAIESFYFLPDFKSLIIAKRPDAKKDFQILFFHDLNFWDTHINF